MEIQVCRLNHSAKLSDYAIFRNGLLIFRDKDMTDFLALQSDFVAVKGRIVDEPTVAVLHSLRLIGGADTLSAIEVCKFKRGRRDYLNSILMVHVRPLALAGGACEP